MRVFSQHCMSRPASARFSFCCPNLNYLTAPPLLSMIFPFVNRDGRLLWLMAKWDVRLLLSMAGCPADGHII